MSDLDRTKEDEFWQNQNSGSSQNLKDQMADAGAEMKQRAGDALRASTDITRQVQGSGRRRQDAASGRGPAPGQAREKQRSAPISSSDLPVTSAKRRAFRDRCTFRCRGINSAAGYVEKMPPRKSATEASETSSTMRPISRAPAAPFALGISVLRQAFCVRAASSGHPEAGPPLFIAQ